MKRKWLGFLAVATLGLAALMPALGRADSVATTGTATSVTPSAADLNGVVSPAYADTAWFFEYSTSATLGSGQRFTRPVPTDTNKEPEAVEEQITDLTPGTAYYFRLIVEAEPNTSGALAYDFGDTHSFTTSGSSATSSPSYGTGSLTSRSLKLSGKVADIVMSCKGAARALCTAKVSLTATGAHGAKVACGTGSFVASVPHTHTVRVRPSRACLALVSKAKRKRLAAIFTATFSTHQSKLNEKVTLIG